MRRGEQEGGRGIGRAVLDKQDDVRVLAKTVSDKEIGREGLIMCNKIVATDQSIQINTVWP